MRILITACPMFGHVNTVLPLALAARRAGHEVVVATGADFAEHVSSRGLTAWAVGPEYAGPPRHQDDFVTAAGKRAVDLVPKVLDWAPDLIVAEEAELAGPVAALRSGAALVVHGLGIAAMGEWETIAPGVAEFGRQCGVPDLAATYRHAVHLSICPAALRPATSRWQRMQPVRPAFGSAVAGDVRLFTLPALPHPRTVHLTLGTVFNTAAGVLETALAGLKRLPVNVVVTVGPGVDPAQLGPQPPHVLVRDYLPHAQLLPHCDLVVSHGGAGVLLGALAHGLPQLVLPQGADQFGNAAAAQLAGAALALEPHELTEATVAAAVGRLLLEPRFAVAARTVRTQIEAMPSPDEVVGMLARHCRNGRPAWA